MINKKGLNSEQIPNQLSDIFVTALEQSYDGVIITDCLGQILYMNEKYCKIFNVCMQDFLGRHVTEIIPNSRMHIVAKTGIPEVAVPWKLKDRNVLVSRYPLFRENKLIGTIGFIVFSKSPEMKEMVNKVQDLEKKLEYFEDALNSKPSARYQFEDIISVTPHMLKLIEKTKKISLTNSNIIISGESGTGKELLAHSIHNYSPRKHFPFVKVNCGAIPKDLFESEFFGYAEGAFTGAKKGGKAGKFEIANHGTIFLDEIEEMPVTSQVKLLRILQEKEFTRIGDDRNIRVDVRIVAASNKNLFELIKLGLFREDLYYRLNVYHIELPLLRERKEDIPLLVRSFLDSYRSDRNGGSIQVDDSAMEVLKNYSWQGNIRELKNVIEMTAGILENHIINVENLPGYLISNPSAGFLKIEKDAVNSLDFKKNVELTETRLILKALSESGGNKKVAAGLLGIARSVLYKKMKDLNIIEENHYTAVQ